MKTNKDILFPYYSGNIKFTKCQGLVSLDYFINAHINPDPKIYNLIERIKLVDSLHWKKLKRKLKQDLYSFTPSVVILKSKKRCYDNVSEYTGLMQLDFDKIESFELALDLKGYLFKNYKQIICSYISPSGKGVKCLMKITKPTDKDHYKAIHKAIVEEFETIDYFDVATKNAMLPLFLSYDKLMLYRDYSECETWIKEDWSKPKYVQLNNKSNYKENINADYNEKKTNRIFVNKIKAIVSDGHTQLRTACLILGSRAGAGYIDINSAISLAEQMIKENNYLQKDINNYISTAHWAINQGFKNPKYYK